MTTKAYTLTISAKDFFRSSIKSQLNFECDQRGRRDPGDCAFMIITHIQYELKFKVVGVQYSESLWSAPLLMTTFHSIGIYTLI